MNKLGKSSVLKTTLVVLLVIVVVAAVFMVARNVQLGKNNGTCQESTAPIAWSSQNTLDLANPVVGISYLVKDGTGASAANFSSYAVGHTLNYVATASGYVAQIETYTIPCGGGTVSTKLTEVAQPLVDIFNSNNLIIDNVATNQSAIGDGASATLGMRLTGVNKKTTGDMELVIETNSSVADLTFGGAKAGNTAPDFRGTSVSPNSKVWTFDVPAITGAVSKTYDLVMTSKDNAHYCGTVYYDLYAKQAFEQSDGSFATGIVTTDGVAEYAEVTSGSFEIACP